MLFRLDAERAHNWTLRGLQTVPRNLLGALVGLRPASAPRSVMGLEFPNPVGLAAGFDKNGECIDGLAALGFGFIEVGTVTPRPQPGNPRPRMFRLQSHRAVINRLGFNNKGVDYLLRQVARSRYRGVLGINIGKNFDTPIDKALDDYLYCLDKVYGHASYVTVNISSPNTKGLRDLQQGQALDGLLAALDARRQRLADTHGRRVPLAIKIAPDLEDDDVKRIADSLVAHRMDAVIATNTTLARPGLEGEPLAQEQGGLSGAPLMDSSTRIARRFHELLDGALPVIGVGGIQKGDDARRKREAGAALVQIYTGLIFRGPALIRESVQAFA